VLAKLLVDLQDPASPSYHRWLSPAAFNTRFDRTDDEINAVGQWLSTQRMSVTESSSRGITSTSTVARAESAFASSMIATTDGFVHANANDPQIPVRWRT
jgi:subtilase family serine protease